MGYKKVTKKYQKFCQVFIKFAKSFVKMDALRSQIEILNLKFDKLILMMENKNGGSKSTDEVTKKAKKPRKPYVEPEEIGSDWSMEYHKNAILVKFSFNKAFKEYVKELGGKWNVSLKGWIFPKEQNDEVYESISAKFEDWEFTDNRTTDEE